MDFAQLIQTQTPARSGAAAPDLAPERRALADEAPGSFRALMRAGLSSVQAEKKPAPPQRQPATGPAKADKKADKDIEAGHASQTDHAGSSQKSAGPADKAEPEQAAEAGAESAASAEGLPLAQASAETATPSQQPAAPEPQALVGEPAAATAASEPQAPAPTSLLEALFIQELPQPPAESGAGAAETGETQASETQASESEASDTEASAAGTAASEVQIALAAQAAAQLLVNPSAGLAGSEASAGDQAGSDGTQAVTPATAQPATGSEAAPPEPATVHSLPAQASVRAREALAAAPGQAGLQQAPAGVPAQAPRPEQTQTGQPDGRGQQAQADVRPLATGSPAASPHVASALDSLVESLQPLQAGPQSAAKASVEAAMALVGNGASAADDQALAKASHMADPDADPNTNPNTNPDRGLGLDQARPELGYGRQGERLSELSPAAAGAARGAQAAPAEHSERFALIRQLSERIQLIHSTRQRSIELSLEPASLGKIQLRLQQQAQAFHLRVFTELPLAKDLIESQIGQLRQHLAAQGIELQQVQIEVHPDPQHFNRQPGQSHQDSPASRRHGRGFSLESVEADEPLEGPDTIQSNDGRAVNTLV